MVELTLVCCAATGNVLVDSGFSCHDPGLLKHKDVAIHNLKKLIKSGKRSYSGSFVTGFYCHHYLFEEQVVCLTTCEKHFPSKLAVRFIQQVTDKFLKMCRSGTGTATEILLRQFRITIEEAQRFYTSSVFHLNYWSLIARSSDGLRLAEIYDDEWNFDSREQYTRKAVSLLLHRTETVEQSVGMGFYKAHRLSVGDICYVTICNKHYPAKLAFEYLNEVQKEFEKKYHKGVQHAKSDGAFCAFRPSMKRIINHYWDTRSARIENVDLDAAYAEKRREHTQKMEDDVLKSVDTNISGHKSDEMSRPLKLPHDNVQVAQQLVQKNAKGQYFRLDADDGSSFQLHLDIYQDLFLHQRQGLHWLWSLHRKGKGGILADDMGLGKTRLVLAFLVGLFNSDLIRRALVVVPKTIVEQWEFAVSEIGLDKICRTYTDKKSHQGGLDYIAKQGGLMIASYPVVERHHTLVVGDITWDYIFLDEGHRLKNGKAKTSKILNAAQCAHKIVVTGTPVQNNISEFYTLINLCIPGLLGTELIFREKFSLAIKGGKHKDATPNQKRLALKVSKELNMVVAPYMLRRTKQILRDSGRLPNKQELTVWLILTPLQVGLYKKLLKIPDFKISGAGLAAAQVARDICNHPLMLTQSEQQGKKGIAAGYVKQLLRSIPLKDDINSSSKISFVLHLVGKLLEQGHRILIFSQSCEMLRFVEKALVEVLQLPKNKILRMDGDTSELDREAMLNAFQPEADHKTKQKKPSDCRYKDPLIFLMTTYVGGVGLNLTNATRVIIMDPAKNPSTDNQSVDRAYRLGQKKNVIVYRLMTCGTIEEHTYREQIIKGELSSSITENVQCERSMLKEKHRVLIAPKQGFDNSVTQIEIEDQFGNGFGRDMSSELRSLRKHKSVFNVSNHSLLFTQEEDVSFMHEVESSGSKRITRHRYQKKKAETVIGGQAYALEPNSEKWAQYKGPPPKVLGHVANLRTKLFPVKKPLGILPNSRREGTKAPGSRSGLGECSRKGDCQDTQAAGPPGGPGECLRKGGHQYDPGK